MIVEKEITHDLALTSEQSSLLDMHSFLNILNVLSGVLTLMGNSVEDEDAVLPAIERIAAICSELADRRKALERVREAEEFRKEVQAVIDALLAAHPEVAESEEISHLVETGQTVFEILQVRVREILARAEQPERWEQHDIAEFRRDFTEFFAAVEKNARGRYRIVYNVAAQDPQDYVVNMEFDSIDVDRITMPPVLKDVFRDLIANSRKYTAPGGWINAGITDDGKSLKLVVEDSGEGIPEEEISKVVNYGHRAANVGNVRTMGAGFGLTKAYFVARQFGGRMWIRSEVGRGTRVTIQISKPS